MKSTWVSCLLRAMRRDPLLKTIPVSCDTYYASVAREAVASGADMINDVSGGTLDAGMMDEARHGPAS